MNTKKTLKVLLFFVALVNTATFNAAGISTKSRAKIESKDSSVKALSAGARAAGLPARAKVAPAKKVESKGADMYYIRRNKPTQNV